MNNYYVYEWYKCRNGNAWNSSKCDECKNS